MNGRLMNGEPFSTIELLPLPASDWNKDLVATIPFNFNPSLWEQSKIDQILDIADKSFHQSIDELRLRAQFIRKERAVGLYPGGESMATKIVHGHGTKKLKKEALDEVVMRVMDVLHKVNPPITLPYCAFNGGRDCWVDIGNKGVAVRVLQSLLSLAPHQCLHVGDQVFQHSKLLFL
jgi:IMP and pyridine-specific 5'-nucleotidase